MSTIFQLLAVTKLRWAAPNRSWQDFGAAKTPTIGAGGPPPGPEPPRPGRRRAADSRCAAELERSALHDGGSRGGCICGGGAGAQMMSSAADGTAGEQK